jgi:4-hydroxybenzoate polyprenyltransferase
MSFVKYFDYIFIARPVLMPPVWTIFLLGYQRAFFYSNQKNPLGWVFLLVSLSIGAVYILNQIYDIESDRINKKLFFLAEGLVSSKSAWIETTLLFSISIISAFFISTQLGILFLIGFIFGILYSFPPSCFKNRPFWGFLSNSIGHGSLAFLLGWAVNDSVNAKAFIFTLPYLLAVGAVYLNTTLPDMEGDRKMGKMTLGVKYGIFTVSLISAILVSISVILALSLSDYPFFFAALLSLPFFVWSVWTKKTKMIILSVKSAVLFLSFVAVYYHPWYFLVLFLGFLGTRIYYKKRFGMVYPTFI